MDDIKPIKMCTDFYEVVNYSSETSELITPCANIKEETKSVVIEVNETNERKRKYQKRSFFLMFLFCIKL